MERPTVDQALLVRQAQSGHRAAFDRLATCYRSTALRYVLSLPRRSSARSDARETAQEVVQAAFLDAWQNLPALRTPEAFSFWLRRILFKHWDRLHRVRAAQETPSELFEVVSHLRSEEPDPGTAFIRKVEATAQTGMLRAAIDTLPAGEQAAVILFYFVGCSHRDVALFLNCTATAVKSRLHSARHRLRERITNMSDDQVATLLESRSALHKDLFQITDDEREELLAGVTKCYSLFKRSYETMDWDEMFAIATDILTDYYQLIFPAHHIEAVWDKRRVENDILKGKNSGIPRVRNTLEVFFEELLSVERDPSDQVIYQATARTTFITANVYRRQIIPRIDIFVRDGDQWKMQRTLSLAPKEK